MVYDGPKKLSIHDAFLLLTGCILFLFSCSSNTDDYFEGEITYDVIMKDHVSGLGAEQMKEMIGAKHTYLFSKGRYKSIAKGSITMNQTYVGGDSLFNEVVGTNEIMWHDVSQYDDKILDFRIEKDVEKVNDILCSVLFIDSEKGVMKYYFNEEYKLNPDNFKVHTNSFWDFCAAKTNSLPIKWITDTNELFFEITATSIVAKKIGDQNFSIPDYPRKELK